MEKYNHKHRNTYANTCIYIYIHILYICIAVTRKPRIHEDFCTVFKVRKRGRFALQASKRASAGPRLLSAFRGDDSKWLDTVDDIIPALPAGP